MFRRSWPRCGTADGRACDQGNRGFMGQSRPLHRTVRRSLGVPCRKAGLRESLWTWLRSSSRREAVHAGCSSAGCWPLWAASLSRPLLR